MKNDLKLDPLTQLKESPKLNREQGYTGQYATSESWQPRREVADNYADPTLQHKQIIEIISPYQQRIQTLEAEHKQLQNDRERMALEHQRQLQKHQSKWQNYSEKLKTNAVRQAEAIWKQKLSRRLKASPTSCKGIGVFAGFGGSLYLAHKLGVKPENNAFWLVVVIFSGGGYYLGDFIHSLLLNPPALQPSEPSKIENK